MISPSPRCVHAAVVCCSIRTTRRRQLKTIFPQDPPVKYARSTHENNDNFDRPAAAIVRPPGAIITIIICRFRSVRCLRRLIIVVCRMMCSVWNGQKNRTNTFVRTRVSSVVSATDVRNTLTFGR